MSADALVPILMCPRCGGEVGLSADSVSCKLCDGRYELSGGIPTFAPVDTGGGAGLPFLYDAAQIAFGARHSVKRVAAQLDEIGPASVLDVGGGTGFYAAAVPRTARYVVADTDMTKLRRLKRRVSRADAILADATNLPVQSDAVDVALFIAVAHHLSDDQLELALFELARVARRRVLFIDPLASSRLSARALWRLDRGSCARSSDELIGRAEAWFDLEHVERYSIRHDYLLWVGTPRSRPRNVTC